MSRNILKIPKLEHDVLVYLAGIIDGEGCFYIAHKIKNMKKETYSPQFKIVLTDRKTIIWIADKLQREYTHIIGNFEKNHKDTYIVRISDREGLLSFIEQIIPYMILKQEVARNMLDFCKSRVKNWNINNSRKIASTYSNEELSMYSKIKQLNKVGKSTEGGYLY